MKTLRLLFTILSWSTILSLGHAAEYRTRHITNQEGLTNSSINVIYQSKSGYVWFGTWDGLNRYDGERIRSFFPSVTDRATISNNIIREMAELPDGTLWIATDRGIDSYDPDTETFTRYFSDSFEQIPVAEHSFHIATSAHGDIVAIVDGHGLFKLRDGVFVREAPLGSKRTNTVFIDQSGRLWTLTDNGQVICDNLVLLSGVSFMYYDKGGDQVWVLDQAGYRPLGSQKAFNVMDEISCAVTDGNYHYLGCSHGLFRLNPYDGTVQCILPDVPVLSVTCGTQDIIWVGTDMHGVWQLSKPPFDFGAHVGMFGGNAVRCFAQSPFGKLAVGTKGSGIMLFSDDGRLTGQLTTRDGLLHDSIYCLKDDGEVLWVGSDGDGLNYMDQRFGHIHTLNLPDSLHISSVYAIQPQGLDTLWVGTSGAGLFMLHLARRGDSIGVSDWTHYSPEQLGSSVVYSLLPTWHGSIFIGTRGAGLQMVDRNTGALKKLRNDINDDILCLARGSDASLWVGTSMGLYRYGNDWEDIVRFSMENGLPSNTIHGINEDSEGYIWVSTNNGLARIRQHDGLVITYHKDDGLQDNEFSDGAFYSAGGWLFFGGIKGFNGFFPADIHKASFMPKLVLTDLFIDNEKVFLKTPNLLLDSGNRSVSMLFAPMDFLNAGDCELSYRLRGLSDEWIRLGNSHVVAVSNLRPGNYTMEVRVSNSEKEWSPDTFILPMRKMAPWWGTPMAILIYVFLGITSLIYIAYRIQVRIRHQREIEQTRTAHDAKLDFFTNIAHEFSNSLTLIYGPCQALLQSVRMTGQEQRYLNSIISNSNRMRNMIQQLIAFRKAETGHLDIHIGKVDMLALIAQETSYFREQMIQNGVILTIDAPPEGVIWTADGDSMEKILFNLLSNAVKYTPSNERIKIALNVNGDILQMDVTNTGVGIPLERQAALFDRYEVLTRFEKALAKGRMSNGIGLSLCKSLVELHKGSIDLKSDGSTFTTFHLELPILPVEKEGLYEIKQEDVPSVDRAEEMPDVETIEKPAREMVLVVDDEPEIRDFICKTLEQHFTVVQAGNGQEALSLLEQELPKVIISDIVMPVMDGTALLKALKSNPKTRHIPIVLLSSKGTDNTPIEALESGADAYLDKPFNPRHLLARINRLLGRDAEVIAYSKSAQAAVEQYAGKEMKKAELELLKAITEVILSRLDDETLSGADLADTVNISEMQLYRKLKALVNMSPTEYVRSLRLDRAANMLVSGNKTIQEIMYACGFVTKTYFFREFSKRFGMSPGEYRRSHH